MSGDGQTEDRSGLHFDYGRRHPPAAGVEGFAGAMAVGWAGAFRLLRVFLFRKKFYSVDTH